jgi:hypothetical protein
VFHAHGLPRQIVSDRDPRFTGTFWRALMQRLQVTQALSSAFHPQTDGNTERVNRVLEDMLRHYVDPSQGNWDSLLPLVVPDRPAIQCADSLIHASLLLPNVPMSVCCCCCCCQVFAAWHNRKRMDREAKRAAEAEDRKKKVRGGGSGGWGEWLASARVLACHCSCLFCDSSTGCCLA